MAVDAARKREIGLALERKQATKPCVRCGHLKFTIVDEILIPLRPLSNSVKAFDTGVPAVMLVCSNCGNLWHHALKSIDLMPPNLQGGSE